MQQGFDSERYLEQQTAAIAERVERFGDKLYLEFGGKLMNDFHASRVLPGYDPNVKVRLLQKLSETAEVVLCIHAGDIERRKMRADFGITYDSDALRLIDDLRTRGVEVRAVVVTRFDNGQQGAASFMKRLERRGVSVYAHRATRGYPTDVELIVSEQGYGANPFIETTKRVVVVTGPGPGSGKLATCLSQLYHERRRGCRAGYAKFETFPIWNLPLRHPLNVAYEAATAELRDVNMVDPYHLEKTGVVAINYNRDVEAFPLLRRIIERITGEPSYYTSPTDMGVNRAGFGIVDDAVVQRSAVAEVIRRYYRYSCEYAMGLVEQETVQRVEVMMKDLEAGPADRPVVAAAHRAAQRARERGKGNEGIYCGAAVELDDGTIIAGENSPLMHAAASLVINAVKHLACLPPKMHLLPATVIASLGRFKKDVLRGQRVSLDLGELLVTLSISAAANPAAQVAVEALPRLRGCEVHMTHMPTSGDAAGLRKLGVNLTSEPDFSTRNLYVS